jgi:histidinol-phosphate phosphatase family protein
MTTTDFSIVVPTVGRQSLSTLVAALGAEAGPMPEAVVLVDDRVTPEPLPSLFTRLPITVLRSGGRGPAAARNLGWRHTRNRWVCFLDDDVLPEPGWLAALAADLEAAEAAGAAASQASIEVPVPAGRRSTDDERRTQRLAEARWITADMAYLRSALVAAGGFDERFPRAYREDSDLALRVVTAGGRIMRGARRSVHPVAAATPLSSVRAQRGNRDNALMRRKHGRRWRAAIGEGRGRMPAHLATIGAATAAALAAVLHRPRWAAVGCAAWLALTAEFAVRRILPGPRTPADSAALAISSVLIPPAAVAHRIAGEWQFRRAQPEPPLAVLFDRDDTLIEDGPYLRDPRGVQPKPGASEGLSELRRRGLLLGVVTNQSGVAKGLITDEELGAVNARVESVLGPFGCWQVCVHDAGDGCRCRKPEPGMVLDAAAALGVDPSRCVMIGDTGGDVEAALAAEAGAVLVPTARTLPHEVDDARRRAKVAPDLETAIAMVLRACR